MHPAAVRKVESAKARAAPALAVMSTVTARNDAIVLEYGVPVSSVLFFCLLALVGSPFGRAPQSRERVGSPFGRAVVADD